MQPKYKHIILADDDIDDATLLQEAFNKKYPDVNFTLADNGAVLLDILKRIPTPDFIILDINMPDLNGIECLKEIKNSDNLKPIPVMMYSTSSNTTDIKQSFKNGADYYVVKPDSINKIELLVDGICSGMIKSSVERPR